MSITLPVFVALDIESAGINGIGIFIDVVFIIDLVLNFFTTFDNLDKILVSDFREIAQEYFQGWFGVDLISSIQISWFGSSVIPREAFRMVKLLKLLKLMRVFRLGRLVGKAQERYQIKHATVMIVKFSFIILFAAHWLGCIFFFISRIQPDDETGHTWLTSYLSDTGLSIGDRNDVEKYIAAMYWALTTMTTIGYGDIIPKTMIERCMTTFCMLVGAFTFAYGLTNVCTLLFNHNKYQVDFECLTDELTEFMTRHSVPRPLQQKVHGLLWFRHNSSSVEDFEEQQDRMLLQLSPQLRDHVSFAISENVFVHLRHVGRSPSLVWGKLMRIEVARLLTGCVYPPEEMIRGDTLRDNRFGIPDKVYYVTKGLCQILKKKTLIAEWTNGNQLSPGASFGELECLCGIEWNPTVGVRAIQHSDVYHISGAALRQIYACFPVEKEAVERVLGERNCDYILTEECGQLNTALVDMSDVILTEGEGALIPEVESEAKPTEIKATEIKLDTAEGSGSGVGTGAATFDGGLSGAPIVEPAETVEEIMSQIIETQERLISLKDSLAEVQASTRLSQC